MDAQRGELFAARFAAGPRHDEQQPTVEVIDRESWVARLTPGDTVTGPGLIRLTSALDPQVRIVEQQAWQPRAGAVGLLAYEQFLAGRREDMFQFVPHYFRRAAAEEQWQRRGGPAS
jgi:tRNA A37 threonylcarbamoyladenosine modification protein TsaB